MSPIIVTDADTLQRFVEAAARQAYEKGAADALSTLPVPAPPEPAYLTAEAVAAMLGCAVGSLRRYRRELSLPFEHIEGVKGYRYRREDVEAWVASRAAKPRRRTGLGGEIRQVRPPASRPGRIGLESARTARASSTT